MLGTVHEDFFFFCFFFSCGAFNMRLLNILYLKYFIKYTNSEIVSPLIFNIRNINFITKMLDEIFFFSVGDEI